jgi:hypothetical protein
MAHDHFGSCLICSDASREWCSTGLELWNAYTQLRDKDREKVRAND